DSRELSHFAQQPDDGVQPVDESGPGCVLRRKGGWRRFVRTPGEKARIDDSSGGSTRAKVSASIIQLLRTAAARRCIADGPPAARTANSWRTSCTNRANLFLQRIRRS